MIPKHVPEIDGVRIEQVKQSVDKRGSFIKFHPVVEFESNLDSVALSFNPQSGTIRGLHFQIAPYTEEKIVTCIQGSIFDVIVDIRPNSKTFGKWSSFELSSENGLYAFLPKGIAHGFQSLQANTIIHYCLTSIFSQESAISINPFDDIGIDWPISNITISEKDRAGMTLSMATLKYAASLGTQ
jgi:dTDP-4-dehydrorhamnose 3,5-epimerase